MQPLWGCPEIMCRMFSAWHRINMQLEQLLLLLLLFKKLKKKGMIKKARVIHDGRCCNGSFHLLLQKREPLMPSDGGH